MELRRLLIQRQHSKHRFRTPDDDGGGMLRCMMNTACGAEGMLRRTTVNRYTRKSLIRPNIRIHIFALCIFASTVWTAANTRSFLGTTNADGELKFNDSIFPFLYPRVRFPPAGRARLFFVSEPTPELPTMASPKDKKNKNRDSSHREPHFGGIAYRSINNREGEDFSRTIPRDDDELYNRQRSKELRYWDQATLYEMSSRDPDQYDHYEELDYPRDCYRPKWSFDVSPSCNRFHEDITLERPFGVAHQRYSMSYLAKGHFRSTWLFADGTRDCDLGKFVLKTNRLEKRRKFNAYSMSQAQIEAVTMLQMQSISPSSSRRTTDIYGHCATSLMVELGQPIADEIRPRFIASDTDRWMLQKRLKKEQVDDVKPMNSLTSEEKLRIAVQMAEGLAMMHGNYKGAIANHDLSLEQYLLIRSSNSNHTENDFTIKLNDFNKAKILHWNPVKQEYCTFYSSQESVYRAPEEILGGQTDESSDVNSLGKIIYSLVTGLRPFYERESEAKGRKAVVAGEEPFVDTRYRTRSSIEGKLVEIMKRCYRKERKDRASIFTVIQELREVAHLESVDLG